MAAVFLAIQFEAEFLVKMSSGVQARKCCQVHALKSRVFAKRNSFLHQTIAEAVTVIVGVDNEPTQPWTFGVRAINKDRADDLTLRFCQPRAVVSRIVSAQKR